MDHLAEVHDPSPTEGCETSVVEGGARLDVDTLDGQVIEHLLIVVRSTVLLQRSLEQTTSGTVVVCRQSASMVARTSAT